jgi:hypothetical protein
MRYVLLLCAVLCGACEYETNYYGDNDAGCGAVDMGYTDQFGDYHSDPNLGAFASDSKLQGNAILQLQDAPPVPAAGLPWPNIMLTPARNGAQTLIDLQTKDGLPCVITVALGNVGPQISFNPMGPAYQPEVVAILECGIGGIQFEIEADFSAGVTFSISCSRLQLHAVYRQFPGVAVPVVAPVPTVQVGASVSSGTIAHGRQPQRTLGSSDNIAAGGLQYWQVPAFSKSFRVVSLPNNITPTVMVSNNAGLNCASYPIAGFPSADLPLPSDASIIAYQNTSLIVDNERRMVFELAL